MDGNALPPPPRIEAKTIDGFNAERSPELMRANRFEPGQISGPFGPTFAGFGEMPPLPWRQRLRPALLGLGCGLAALALLATEGKL